MPFVSCLWHTWSRLKSNPSTKFAFHCLLVFKFVTESVVLVAMVYKVPNYLPWVCHVASFLQVYCLLILRFPLHEVKISSFWLETFQLFYSKDFLLH
jgi:hypothetical protein